MTRDVNRQSLAQSADQSETRSGPQQTAQPILKPGPGPTESRSAPAGQRHAEDPAGLRPGGAPPRPGQPTDAPPPRLPSRRRLIGSAAGLAIGAVGGLATGVAVANAAEPPATVQLDGLQRYRDKVVLITGATSGIGRAAALAFGREGARVALCGRRERLGEAVADEIRRAGGQALFVRADVRDEAQVSAFVDATVASFGGLDIAINNAGITREKALHEFSSAEWDEVIQTNLRGVFLGMKYQIPALLARGGGTILMTSSLVAHSTAAGRSVYSATKAGLIGMARAAALDYGGKGIRINAILPGTTDTALVRDVAGMAAIPDAAWAIGAAQWGRANVPGLGRMARPEEIAAFMVAMASPDLSYLTGSDLSIHGGVGTA